MINDYCNIWCSYIDENKLKHFDITENDNYLVLFKTNNLDYKEININYLHQYLNDFVTLYYVYVNHIYSKYVGFCNYRRFFERIDFNKLNNDKIQVYQIFGENIEKNNKFNFGNYKLFSDININFKYDPIVKTHIKITQKNMFICKYEIFEKLMEKIIVYLNYFFPNFETNIEIHNYNNRKLAYVIEFILGIIIGNCDNEIFIEKPSVYIMNDDKYSLNDVFEKYNKLIKNGFCKIYYVSKSKYPQINYYDYEKLNIVETINDIPDIMANIEGYTDNIGFNKILL